jgi:hypothetical protein
LDNHRHFIIIGAQRSGTTFLYDRLNAHPEVEMNQPMRPEPKYFLNKEVNYGSYLETCFEAVSGEGLLLGEKSTSYYEHPEVIDRIKSVLPDVKLICMLRNPIERALSNYFFTLNHGLETRSLEEVFIENRPSPKLKNNVSVDPFDYLGRGEYDRHLKAFKEAFSDHLKMFLFEDIVSGTGIDSVFTFLNLELMNKQQEEKGQAINKSERLAVPDQVRQRLRDYYHPRINSMERNLGLDLKAWK